MPTAARRRPQAIKAEGGRAQFVQTDVGDAGQAQRLVDQTLAAFGRLDVLINNAGIIKTAEFLEISEADFDAVLRVNLKGVFLVGQAAARVMVRQGKGAIVNMSSANAVVAIPNQVPYVTSKGAVNQLTKVMALALADKGVRVNAIGPGSILTDLLKVVMSDDAARQRILVAHAHGPLRRAGGGRQGRPVSRERRRQLSHRAVHLSRRRATCAQLHGAGAGLRSRSTVCGSANLPRRRFDR